MTRHHGRCSADTVLSLPSVSLLLVLRSPILPTQLQCNSLHSIALHCTALHIQAQHSIAQHGQVQVIELRLCNEQPILTSSMNYRRRGRGEGVRSNPLAVQSNLVHVVRKRGAVTLCVYVSKIVCLFRRSFLDLFIAILLLL